MPQTGPGSASKSTGASASSAAASSGTVEPGVRRKYASIHEAVRVGDVEELERMVRDNASVNEVDQREKFTSLHWAAYVGALEVVFSPHILLFALHFFATIRIIRHFFTNKILENDTSFLLITHILGLAGIPESHIFNLPIVYALAVVARRRFQCCDTPGMDGCTHCGH